jgi:hypothetical protein
VFAWLTASFNPLTPPLSRLGERRGEGAKQVKLTPYRSDSLILSFSLGRLLLKQVEKIRK